MDRQIRRSRKEPWYITVARVLEIAVYVAIALALVG
jgi:hypothetical protein